MKQIPGWDGYFIEDNGIVHSFHKKKHIIRKVSIKKGYMVCALSYKHKLKHIAIHRLVAMTFLPNNLTLPCVNHKDGNKLNNHVSNLEWCDRLFNANHAAINGLYKTGSDHGRARIVLNTQNGVFFGTVKEAAESVNNRWSRQNLNCMLTGRIKNVSQFIYA